MDVCWFVADIVGEVIYVFSAIVHECIHDSLYVMGLGWIGELYSLSFCFHYVNQHDAGYQPCRAGRSPSLSDAEYLLVWCVPVSTLAYSIACFDFVFKFL